MTAGQVAEALGLRTAAAMTARALAILRRPWRAEESTAQPPYRCTHERYQDTRHGPACALCGAPRSGFFKRRGLP